MSQSFLGHSPSRTQVVWAALVFAIGLAITLWSLANPTPGFTPLPEPTFAPQSHLVEDL